MSAIMTRDQRDAVLHAAAADLLVAATERAEFILPPKAAGFLAEILLWVTGREITPLASSAVMLAECLVVDESERMTTADERYRPGLPLHRTEAGWPRCSTCDGGGCPDCTDPA